jgi:hypothetical protein
VEEGGGALNGFSSRSRKGEEERMGEGGPGPVSRGRREMGERVGPGASVGSARRRNMAGNGPRPSGAGDAIVAEQGRAAGRGRRSVTEKRCQASRGPGVSDGVREGERSARKCGGGALTYGPGQHIA